ncbi:SHOCT domain-containing protein [Natronolimnobius sp. AArcel1]|uniref:SHOCT domain-containing protein n=1 Tax=Natronolimnobius sp. AArcel1 TaxID=1679093 RepID=UPI0013EC6E69|nr:SHOCT domain-containing protein [Natronolimnobius sp. AArcel1]NGM68727.1 SHOCT domain-containing protein [Natronolimnobius sp. AArcel1]
MTSRRPDESPWRRWHALVEQYTPDGALGRWLLGSVSSFFGFWMLVIFGAEVIYWGLSLAMLFWTTVLLGVGIPMVLVGLLTLWPLYLSLIGNLESAADYSLSETPTRANLSAETPQRETSSEDDVDSSDPFADLKRQYAAGDLSEDEFERRLDARLDEIDASTRGADDETTRDRLPDHN